MLEFQAIVEETKTTIKLYVNGYCERVYILPFRLSVSGIDIFTERIVKQWK